MSNPSSGASKVEPSDKFDLSALRQWIVAICAIRFDLEQGQVVEDCFPSGALSIEEESDVAFSSFPDSMTSVHNRASLHDSLFFFKLRRRGTPQAVPERPPPPIPQSPGSSRRNQQKIIRTPSDGGQSQTRRSSDTISDLNRRSSGGESPIDSPYKRTFNQTWVPGEASSLPGSSSPPPPSAAMRTLGGSILMGNGVSPIRKPFEVEPSSPGSQVFPRRGSGIGIGVSVGDPGGRRGSLSPLNTTNPDSIPRTPPAGSRGGPGAVGVTGSVVGGGGLGSGKGGLGGLLKLSHGPGSGGQRYLYGFVFNRQRHDERLRRGGEQKSVVVLSEAPYSFLFRSLVQLAGPMYFDFGPMALEQVGGYVARWPPPIHGATMELAVGASVLNVTLPPAHTLPPSHQTPLDDFTAAMAPAPHNKALPQGLFHEADLFGLYKGVLLHLWVLWEILIVGEPLLLIAPSPSQCSEAVGALVGLTAPLPCSLDFRPYFTIHDPDFPLLNALREGDPIPPMLLGVTNLFFLRALKRLPHVLSVGKAQNVNFGGGAEAGGGGGGGFSARFRSGGGRLHPNSQVSAKALPARLQINQMRSPLRGFSLGVILSHMARARREGPLSLMSEHKEALWTNYEPATKPDTAILNRLLEPQGGGEAAARGMGSGSGGAASETISMINNELLRRHFLELTTNFLAPFGPFLRAAAPPEGTSPFNDPPPPPPLRRPRLPGTAPGEGPRQVYGQKAAARGMGGALPEIHGRSKFYGVVSETEGGGRGRAAPALEEGEGVCRRQNVSARDEGGGGHRRVHSRGEACLLGDSDSARWQHAVGREPSGGEAEERFEVHFQRPPERRSADAPLQPPACRLASGRKGTFLVARKTVPSS